MHVKFISILTINNSWAEWLPKTRCVAQLDDRAIGILYLWSSQQYDALVLKHSGPNSNLSHFILPLFRHGKTQLKVNAFRWSNMKFRKFWYLRKIYLKIRIFNYRLFLKFLQILLRICNILWNHFQFYLLNQFSSITNYSSRISLLNLMTARESRVRATGC